MVSNGGIMRKIYKVLLCIIFINLLIVSFMNNQNIRIQSWAENAIGVLVFFLPIQILLFVLGRDDRISNRKRKWTKMMFWFINICYLLGAAASLI